MNQSKKWWLFLFLGLLFGVVLLIRQPTAVQADAQCGVGYTCWPENGGEAVLYADCELDPYGYCHGTGTRAEYCSCEGSADCSCDIGPGTGCPSLEQSAYDYYCSESLMTCDASEVGEACTDYSEPGNPYTDPDDICERTALSDPCGTPTGYSTIGCCFGDGPDSSYCGDGTCDPDETCGSCEIDCGVCPPTCPAITADVKVNGSDADIIIDIVTDYTISWTSSNADACEINTISVTPPASGSQVETADTNGNYTYTLECDSTCGEYDSDDVMVTVDLCGDGTCAAFENCLNCPEDCGACPTAWWQAWGGSVYAGFQTELETAIYSLIPSDVTCAEPNCHSYLIGLDRLNVADSNSDGFTLTGGAAIETDGAALNPRAEDIFAIGITQTRFQETYSYFARQYDLGLSPEEDFTGAADDAQKPVYDADGNGEADQEYYYHSGDLTVQSVWDVVDGEEYAIFVDGNLTISDSGDAGELITVAEGGFLAFIVSGNITVSDNVGHSVLSNDAGNVEGVYVADGTLTVASTGGADERFVGEGTFVGWTDVVLEEKS